MTLAELEEKLSLMARSSTCNVEPSEAREMLAAVRKAIAELDEQRRVAAEAQYAANGGAS